MKPTKRIVCMILCALMLFSLCACGGNGDAGTSSGVQGALTGFDDETVSGIGGAQTSGADTSDPLANVSGTVVESQVELSGDDPFANIPKRLRGTTVVFAHWGDEGAAEFQKVAKAFTKKTGIKVQWKTFNEAQYVAQIAKQIVGGAAPDIVICNGQFPRALEILQPVQNITNLNDEFWDDKVTEESTIGNNTYLLNGINSIWSNMYLVFYNKNLFSQNGIKTPTEYYKEGTWSYENMKKCMEQVKKANNEYIGGFVDPQTMNNALGCGLYTFDSKTDTFKNNSQKSAVGYQFAAQCFKEGLWSSTDWYGTFSSGKIGLYMTSTYGMRPNGYLKDCDDNMLAAVPLPTSYKGAPTKQVMTLRAYGIAKGANNPEGAVYFLRYFLDYDYYTPAGAKAFKNKALEKTFLEELVPLYKKEGYNRNWETISRYSSSVALHSDGILKPSDSDVITRMDPTQIPSIITSKNNVFETVVKEANATIKKHK